MCCRSEHKDQQRETQQFTDPRIRRFLGSAVCQESAGSSSATSAWSLPSPTTRRRWPRPQSSTITGWSWSWLTIMSGWPWRRGWVQCPCSSGWQELHFIYTWGFIRSGQTQKNPTEVTFLVEDRADFSHMQYSWMYCTDLKERETIGGHLQRLQMCDNVAL